MPLLSTRGAASARGFGLLGRVKAITDPFFNYVTMLLRGDGTNGAQNNTFLDSSTNNFTITRNGNTTQGSFSPYGPNWSNYVDGNLDYLYCTPSNLTGQYTIEGWFCADDFNTAINRVFFGNWTTGFLLRYNSNNLEFYSKPGGSTVSGTVVNPLNAGQWYHIQVTRDSSNVQRVFVDGVVKITTAAGAGTITMTNFCIGAENTSVAGTGDQWKGYISNFRILNGTCLNTSNFTPPTQPLTAVTNTSLLTCQSNRFIDNSSNNLTITRNGDVSVQRFSPFAPTAAYSTATIGGSGYFDGAGDYLTTGTTSALAFGTGDFTTECWVYLPTNASLQSIFNINQFNTGILVRYDNSSNGYALFLGGTQYNSGVTTVGQWVHLAAARASGTVRFFVNGVQTNSASNTYSVGNANFTAGTAAHSLSETMTGYISNFRAVNGTAVYTAAFTPPTAPVTAITNTSLLLNFTNGAIFDNAMMNDLETVGNAQISTSVKKFGTGSLAFDGSGDVLTAPMNPGLALGTGDFTVEWWAYMTTVGTVSEETFLCTRGIGQGIQFTRRGSNWTLDLNSTAPSRATASGVLSNNNWIHLAATRQSGTIRLFTNGTLNTTVTGNTDNFAGTLLAIGSLNANTDYNFNGYIDDLRITKGVARYTANFTPPTAAFPNQ